MLTKLSQGQRTLLKQRAVSLLIAASLPHTHLAAGQGHSNAPGVAWRVIGQWRTDNSEKAISDGEAILPGSLLQAAGDPREHSITILLPDGQRVLYECYAERDCARGFRVPVLYRKPEPMAVDLLNRVNAVEKHRASIQSNEQQRGEFPVPRDEAVSLLGPGNQVQIGGLAARLYNGRYSYTVTPLSNRSTAQPRREFNKQGDSITLTFPSAGLFDVLITDQMNTPRIDLLVAAVQQPAGQEIVKSFQRAEALLKDWNEDYQGWPVHEFRRDYLRSIMLRIEPAHSADKSASMPSTQALTPNAACEPQFDPAPGVFKADLEVRLQCGTPGAIVYYTVDGSEPLQSTTVYRAPIEVKGTALTIKAFATATGRKDGPVVTGIFRIGD